MLFYKGNIIGISIFYWSLNHKEKFFFIQLTQNTKKIPNFAAQRAYRSHTLLVNMIIIL